MPVDNGIVYSDYNEGLNTGRGISWNEVAKLLGTIPDEATMCCSEKVNGLSRYRPVKWDTPVPANMQDIRTQHASRVYWMENTAVGTPWIYGQGYDNGYRTIVAPIINMTFDQLVDASGNLNTATKWIFNRPAITEFTHIDHFHGYNHKAKPSIHGRVEGGRYNNGTQEISIGKGTLHVGLKPEMSLLNYNYALRKEDGCWAPSELLKIINFPTTAYVGVAIRNRNATTLYGNRYRYSVGTVGVIYPDNTIGSGANAYKEIDVMSHHTEGNFYFDLFFKNRQNTLNAAGPEAKGLYMDVYTGDILDVVVFLSDKAITSQRSMTAPTISGYSLYINNDYKPIQTFKVVQSTAARYDYDVPYQYEITSPIQQSTGTIDLERSLYLRFGSNIYSFDEVIKGVKFPSSASTPIVISMPGYDDYESGVTDVGCFTTYYMQNGDIFYLPTGYQTVDFKAKNGIHRMGWSPTRIEVYTSRTDAVQMNLANAIYLDDYMRNELGMSASEVANNAGYLPVYFTGGWNVYNNNDLRQISANVDRIVVGVNCVPQWEVDSEFVHAEYHGDVEYVGNEANRLIWD